MVTSVSIGFGWLSLIGLGDMDGDMYIYNIYVYEVQLTVYVYGVLGGIFAWFFGLWARNISGRAMGQSWK